MTKKSQTLAEFKGDMALDNSTVARALETVSRAELVRIKGIFKGRNVEEGVEEEKPLFWVSV